ncbi:MAG TPA: rod shape-determining protein RodA [Actinomycetales bacterium]|nr:rod shape-determining protein RodA [Actinomycetales bacterium]
MRRAADLDWVLVLAALAASVLGVLLVWSATRADAGGAVAGRQAAFVVVGVAVAAVVASADLRRLRAVTPWVYLAAVAGLVTVLTPLGSTVNGSRSWISLPSGFSLQPAEVAKLALVVGIALLLTDRAALAAGPRVPRDRSVVLALLAAGVPLGLVLAQPDLGSGVVLAALVLGMVAVSGARARWVVSLVAVGAAGLVVVLAGGFLEGYQRDRLVAFTDPDADPRGIGYQTRQVRIAIGSGGLLGRGLFAGAQTQGGLVPHDHTDFVFSVAGEELGFAGAALLLALLGVVLWRAVRTGLASSDEFGVLVAGGVACWLAFQVFANVGMNLGIMPVTGLPLPFVSYGGSSMVAAWAAVGLLLNVRLAGSPSRR